MMSTTYLFLLLMPFCFGFTDTKQPTQYNVLSENLFSRSSVEAPPDAIPNELTDMEEARLKMRTFYDNRNEFFEEDEIIEFQRGAVESGQNGYGYGQLVEEKPRALEYYGAAAHLGDASDAEDGDVFASGVEVFGDDEEQLDSYPAREAVEKSPIDRPSFYVRNRQGN